MFNATWKEPLSFLAQSNIYFHYLTSFHSVPVDKLPQVGGKGVAPASTDASASAVSVNLAASYCLALRSANLFHSTRCVR